MKKRTKILSVFLAILMVISIIPITASAATVNYAGDSVLWEIKNGVLMFGGSGEMYSYTSSTVPWRSYKDQIKEISIDEDITSIGDYAFYGLNITEVEIPEGVRKIGTYAFANCTSLSKVVIHKGVNIIDTNAFANCKSLENVYYYSPQNDWGLINIRTGNNDLLNAELFVNGNGKVTWEFDSETGTLTFNGNGKIPDYYNEDEDYFIKQPWDDIEKDIKHIVFNEGITSIGAYAFAYCDSLETVTMSSVVTIGDHAFYDCPVLKKLTTSNSLKVIGDHAFRDCKKFTYIYYSGTQEEWNNVSIGEHWNDEMDKVKVYPSDYVVYSDSGTFRALTGGNTFSWEFDADTLTLTVSGEGDIGLIISLPWKNYQFDIKKLVLSDGITSVYSVIFSTLPNLTEIVIPASISKISKESFNNSNHCITDVYYTGTEEQWKSITIGENNDALLKANIHYNYHIHKYNAVVTAPTCTEQGYTTYTCECGDTYVGDYVDALGHIDNDNNNCCDKCSKYILPTSGTYGDNVTWTFDESTGTLTFSGTGAMQSATSHGVPWNGHIDSIESVIISEGVTTIGDKVFYNHKNIKNVSIADSVTDIGDSAFDNCTSLTDVIIGNSVTNIGAKAFYDCDALTDVVIGKGVTMIDEFAFQNCSNLKTVTIHNAMEEICRYSFNSCPNLTDVYYFGTEAEWNAISKGFTLAGIIVYGTGLENATIHFLGKETHECSYNAVVTPPTCTEQGYTTYTCECGDSYVDDYVNATGHNYKNGVCEVCGTGIKGDYFYINGVKQKAYQLVEFEGNFYFINDSHKLAKNKRIYLSERFVNGFTYADGTPLKVGYYEFDAEGKMIINNGVVGDYFYINGVRQNAYQLIEFEGNYYFINDSHKVAKNKRLYMSAKFVEGTDLKVGYYEFDADGKMILKNGPDGDYFYINGVRQNAYQLVEFEGNYYFINDSHKLAKNKRLYMSQRFVEGTDLKVGYYEFDADGKMIIE